MKLINKMKKIKLVLLLICSFGIVNAQTDTSTNKKISLKKDSITNTSDRLYIGKNNSSDTITMGSMVIIKKQADQEISKGKKNIELIANKDSVKFGPIMIVTNNNAKKPDFKTIIKIGDASYGKPLDSSAYDWYKGSFKKTKVEFSKTPKKVKKVSTNWFSFDLGYTNYQDKSPELFYAQIYQSPNIVTPSNLKLINAKSSNFNLWIVQQKVNLYKNKFNIKYGVGFEMFNFRLEQPVSFRNDNPNKMFLENLNFSKNKLFVKYLTVPFQFNFKSDPNSKKSFYMSMGMSAGYLVDARNKQKSSERGKQK
ncbi:MAG: hypothetical protein ACR2IM_09530, partial [Sediminibacterium sp.]